MTKLKYDESFPERAGEYAAKGMKNIEIAARLGISSDSFYVYLRQFPAFAKAVEDGRLAVADMADYSLMDLATGNCYVTTVKRENPGSFRFLGFYFTGLHGRIYHRRAGGEPCWIAWPGLHRC